MIMDIVRELEDESADHSASNTSPARLNQKKLSIHPKEPVSIALTHLGQVVCNVFGSQSTPHLSSPVTLAMPLFCWSSPIPFSVNYAVLMLMLTKGY